jgi:hypothetical protein
MFQSALIIYLNGPPEGTEDHQSPLSFHQRLEGNNSERPIFQASRIIYLNGSPKERKTTKARSHSTNDSADSSIIANHLPQWNLRRNGWQSSTALIPPMTWRQRQRVAELNNKTKITEPSTVRSIDWHLDSRPTELVHPYDITHFFNWMRLVLFINIPATIYPGVVLI